MISPAFNKFSVDFPEDISTDNSDLCTSYPDVAKYLTITKQNVINKMNSSGISSANNSADKYTFGNYDIVSTLCLGKKTRFVRPKSPNSENVVIEFDLVFDFLVTIVTIELELVEGSVDQSYWREGRLNNKPIVLGKNKLSFTVSPAKSVHNFQLSFSNRSYGTLYLKKFRFKAIWYKTKPSSKHTRDLENMVNCEEFSDVWFEIEGKRLCAARYILSARSEYFYKLLLGNMKEANKQEVVQIHSTTYSAFKAVILYLYTGTLCQLDVELSLQMLRLAHLYLIYDLEEELQSYLLCHISDLNANDILLISHELELKSLKDYALNYTLEYVKAFDTLMQQPQLLAEVAQGLASKVPKKMSPKRKNKH
jgi:hypothetical protein